ncbi:hypothetical protein NDU88_003357 [Pleurodeles waltl]|uniref:Uncharacterized protein n=1 Tax=Pleurodeles waltl TaxID=8319 RepID=A0AAV7NGF0_PLEWA|nr:hypothetical protein NDU88_003357 [Pleurodeles waltl]
MKNAGLYLGGWWRPLRKVSGSGEGSSGGRAQCRPLPGGEQRRRRAGPAGMRPGGLKEWWERPSGADHILCGAGGTRALDCGGAPPGEQLPCRGGEEWGEPTSPRGQE